MDDVSTSNPLVPLQSDSYNLWPFLLLAGNLIQLRAAMLAPKDLTPMRETPPVLASQHGVGTSSLNSSFAVDEDTDLSTLTTQQIYELNQNMLDEASGSGSNRPLISALEPISVLREEYQSTNFVNQIDRLREMGYTGIMRTRGDGDCFYRSIGYAYIQKILTSPDKPLAAATALSNLDMSQTLLEQAGFQKLVYEEFYDVFASMIGEIAQPRSNEGVLTEDILLRGFQDSEVSNSVVVYLRLLTSALIRAEPENYAPFLLHPDLGIPMEPIEFCSNFVEAIGKEADHVQVAALSRALNLNVQVAYLDGRSADGHVDFVPFSNNEDHSTTSDVILLYRPGHYDVLQRGDEGLKDGEVEGTVRSVVR